MFEVRLTTQAEHTYTHLDSTVRDRVDQVLEQLEQGNFSHHNICILRGQYAGSLRYRLGKWRIIFHIDHTHQIIWVEAITTRGGAYR
jgi:mRNA interferase RelE/StbE